MDAHTLQRRRVDRARARRTRRRRRLGALAALGLLALAAVALAVVVLTAGTGSGTGRSSRATASTRARTRGSARGTHAGAGVHGGAATPVLARLGPATGHPGDARVPILMYHVINPPPAGAPYPGLYVPPGEFAAQMHALAHAGWHAVTLDEVREDWRHGNRLPARPIVITFDNGYLSQYSEALPILRQMHWAAVENLQLSGLPPAQGGMTTTQVRGLIGAGWELDTQGISHADLPALTPTALRAQIDQARARLRARYHVPVNWFCYPSGQYDPAVVTAVRADGFAGSTTVVPGWASRDDSSFALPRLRVLGGTTPAELLAQIRGARDDDPTPGSYLTSTP